MPTSIPPPPTGPFRVTAAETLASGSSRWRPRLPPGVTEWQLTSGEYVRLFSRVYIHRDTPITEYVLAQAAMLICPRPAAASHQTAARIWGGVVPDDGLVHLIEAGSRRKVAGIRSHRVTPESVRCLRVGDLEVVAPDRTFVDLARDLSLVDLVVLGDSLIRRGVTTVAALEAASAAYRGNGAQNLRQAVRLVRAEVDSPMETRLRLLLALAGLPEPAVNHALRRRDGSVRYRFDLSYPAHKLIIEYDGRQHAEDDRQWGNDLARREWIDANGWRIIVVRASDLYSVPGRTLTRIIEAMRAVGMPIPRVSREWQRHFPGRPGDAVPA